MSLTDDHLEYMDDGVERARRLMAKLRRSLVEAEAMSPIAPDRIVALTMAEQIAFDVYLKHFQDAFEIGKVLFRSGLLLARFGWPKLSYLDLVNEAERYGVLPSAAAWLDVMDARNSAAHEYAMRPVQQAALLTEAVKQGRVLLAQLDAALEFTTSRRSSAGSSR